MTILLLILKVPPTAAAGSNVVFLCLLFLFSLFLSCAGSPWFSFYFVCSSSFCWLTSRINRRVVWRGWMTNLLCSFRIVWRQGAGHSWRTQGGDGSLGSKVPGGLAGRTCLWLYYSYHKLLPLPGGWFVLWFACYLPFVIFPCFFVSLCLQVVVFLFCFFFSSSFFFKCLPHRLRGGGHDSSSFLLLLFFSSSFFSFDLSSLFPFVSLFHRMCMSCLSYPVSSTMINFVSASLTECMLVVGTFSFINNWLAESARACIAHCCCCAYCTRGNVL